MAARWHVVIPIKPLAAAKSRLRGAVPDDRHAELVLAMAQDTIAAAVACPAVARVVVVCDDPLVRAAATELGAAWVPDAPHRGLNEAISYGARDEENTAALTADLPALTPGELEKALGQVTARSFVPDAEGTGTVLLAAPRGETLDPHFGIGSAEQHERGGAKRLALRAPSLRRDVDTPADLEAGKVLGLGPHTDRTLCAIASIAR
jgi:2-phospho-L-lactate/phosphoenolpyruvate guanylyltransferase